MNKSSGQRGNDKVSVAKSSIGGVVGEMEYDAYIGLDVHKDSIAITVPEFGRQLAQILGEIVNRPTTVEKFLGRLDKYYPLRIFQNLKWQIKCA